MPLFSEKEILNLKLNSLYLTDLKELALLYNIRKSSSASEIIKSILEKNISEKDLDDFIKQKYATKIAERRKIISDTELKRELLKVQTFSWGVIQGQLDWKIQTEYVRKIVRYDELLKSVKSNLYNDITNYVICTWFNHWTTVLIEEHISLHPKVIPTIKNVKGIDIFFDNQPFDLKITYLPRGYNPDDAVKNPKQLAIWLYENQGEQRFGSDNRLFVVVLDKENIDESWKLKRDFDFVFQKIDEFLDKEKVSKNDEIVFSYKRKTYTAITKILMITK
ncbi:MAG: hypothetical protein NZ927_08945 [Candidatus Calescibacterium sp.]|nr:hypothetical protein [Candidatus Calescibacterium sp.]MCX7734832.1 hypothetical protein [bacterium]